MKQVKIKSISKIEHKSKRYDISVTDNNNLFANNILIHNCQNLNWKEFFEQFADKEVYVTEKIDYQSATFTGKMVPRFKWLKLPIVSGYKKEQINKIKSIGKTPFKVKVSGYTRYTLSESKKQVESRNIGHIVKPISWVRFMFIWKLTNWKFLQKYQFVVCSRNLVINDKNSLYWKIVRKYNLEQILKKNPTLTIQGEQGDTKVQGNKYGITEPTMWVFNIIDYEKNYHYNYDEMQTFCTQNNLDIVPILMCRKLHQIGTTIDKIVSESKGNSRINRKIKREGIVVRCIENGKKILSFKAINPDFLLKYDN